MKANAKKLLALILAMVMCLSLAAPAMAASVDAAAEATLSLQENSNPAKVVAIELADEGEDEGYTVYWSDKTDVGTETNLASNTNLKKYTVKWKDAATNKEVTVAKKDLTDKKIGGYKQTEYTVTANSYYGTTQPKLVRNVDDKNTQYSLKDTDVAWTTLTEAQSKFESAKDDWRMVQGSYFVETLNGGEYNCFFKLTKTNDAGDSFVTSGDDKTVFAVATLTSANMSTTPTIDNLQYALANADLCSQYGVVAPNTNVPSIRIDEYKSRDLDWRFSALASDGTSVGTELKVADAINAIGVNLATIAGDTATYQVYATYRTNDGSKDITKAETDASRVESQLKDGIKKYGFGKYNNETANPFEVTGVTAGTNGYFNVSVKKVAATQSLYKGEPKANTAYWMGIGGNVVLIDAAQPGTYKPETSTGDYGEETAIAEGYKYDSNCYAVKKSDIDDAKIKVATNTNVYDASTGKMTSPTSMLKDGWYYFYRKQDMVDAFTTDNCTITKTVSYKQLVAFDKEGTTDNEGVKISDNKANVLEPVDGWAAKAGAVTKAGTMDVTGPHGPWLVVKKTTPATCLKEGEEVTEVVCGKCNKVHASSIVSKIPKVEIALVTSTKDYNYIVDENNWKKYVPEALQNKYTNWADYKKSPDAHYVAEHEAVIVKNDKDNTGTVTHKFKCNHGEYLKNLEYTEELKKAQLQYSGRWDYMATLAQNTQYARDPSMMYGYTFQVADTDVEYTSVPMIDGYDYFKFPVAASGANLILRPDGTYIYLDGVSVPVSKVDSTGKVVTETNNTDYMAVARVKNIKVAEKDCLDGSATVEITVYKLAAKTPKLDSWKPTQNDEGLEDAIKAGEVTLVKTHTKDIVVKAVKDHIDANGDGKCDNCGTEIKQNTTPEPQPETKTLTASMVTVKNLTYTGKKQQPEVTVKAADGTELEEGIDYDVATFKKTAVGTYTITVKGKGDWSGKVKATVKIKKAANPIKVAKTSVSVKAKDVKKKAKTIALKVTKAQGKVTVKSSKKKVVSWKNNKITVAKGAKKGTYKLTFTAKGNKNYKKGTKTVKVVVK